MLKVKTSLLHERGSKRQTSFGELQFNDQGISQQIDDTKAKRLAQVSGSLTLVGDENQLVNEQIDQTDNSKDENKQQQSPVAQSTEQPPEPDTEPGTAQSQQTTPQQLKDNLSDKPIAEIREMLQELGVEKDVTEKDEYKGREGKPKLIDMLVEKLSE